jgi:hypothetical protein
VTRIEFNIYQRGYNACLRNHRAWPAWCPPVPEDAVIKGLIESAEALRNGVDGFLATLDEQDDVTQELGPKLDAVTEALAAVKEWVLKQGAQEQPK